MNPQAPPKKARAHEARIVLGLETSCDETAAAVVRGDGQVLAEALVSQTDEHARFGGVVPEIAARAHLESVDRITARAMAEAGVGFEDLTAAAAAAGPGLIGGVIVGAMTAKAVALAHDIPFLAVNHLEGHALSPRLTPPGAARPEFPYLLLLVSGGHCQLISVAGFGRYRRLGATIDDALGEAFDKTAKLLGLGFPGGPAVERAAAKGDAGRFELPRPMRGRPGCDFSFAGLKSAVRRTVEKLDGAPGAKPGAKIDAQTKADIAAAFQLAAVETVIERTRRGWNMLETPPPALVCAGGVAANGALRRALAALAEDLGCALHIPEPSLCTDNARMIAWAALERLAHNPDAADGLDFKPRPRWPLDPDAAPLAYAGAKA
ncbi:MAG: tRNA (adenosine(37)-N6)-threonylcarbamoyltransferase complex transferase subunit TsaD [Rhodospirillales bacterium]